MPWPFSKKTIQTILTSVPSNVNNPNTSQHGRVVSREQFEKSMRNQELLRQTRRYQDIFTTIPLNMNGQKTRKNLLERLRKRSQLGEVSKENTKQLIKNLRAYVDLYEGEGKPRAYSAQSALSSVSVGSNNGTKTVGGSKRRHRKTRRRSPCKRKTRRCLKQSRRASQTRRR